MENQKDRFLDRFLKDPLFLINDKEENFELWGDEGLGNSYIPNVEEPEPK